MFVAVDGVKVRWMQITIQVDAVGPPSGALVVDRGDPQPFVGWLELLRMLSDLMPPGERSPGTAQRLPGQLHAGAEIQLGQDV